MVLVWGQTYISALFHWRRSEKLPELLRVGKINSISPRAAFLLVTLLSKSIVTYSKNNQAKLIVMQGIFT